MLLAAGMGSRLRPYTDTRPKPAIPFMTVPMLCYSLALLDSLKIHNLVINLHHLPEEIRQLVKDTKPRAGKIIYSDETSSLLGSGGGIHHAWPSLKGRGAVLVANADEVILPYEPYVLRDMMEFHRQQNAIATILTIDHPLVGSQFGGAWVNEKSQIQTFSKTPVNGLKGHHFIGVMVLDEKVEKYFKPLEGFAAPEENILYETLTKAMQAGEKVMSYQIRAEWFETGNPQDFLKATEACLKALPHRDESAPYWTQYLAQTMRWHSSGQTFIEEGDLKSQVLKCLDEVRVS